MSILSDIEDGMKGSVGKLVDFLKEDAEGAGGKDDPVAKALDKIKEAVDTIGDFFTFLDQKTWWGIIKGILEILEDFMGLFGKALGGPGGEVIKMLAKLLTAFGTGIGLLGKGAVEHVSGRSRAHFAL